jgi:hypothetical protein
VSGAVFFACCLDAFYKRRIVRIIVGRVVALGGLRRATIDAQSLPPAALSMDSAKTHRAA